MPIGYPSSPEERLNHVSLKKLRCPIRTCLPMFAAHLVTCKSNLFVIQGCNIDATMVPNSHAENKLTFNRKMSNMKYKCGPEGVPKTEENQYRTVLLVSGRSLVSVLSQLQRSWNLTGCCGRYERQTRSRRHGKLSTASKNSHLGGSTFGASSGRACARLHLAFC